MIASFDLSPARAAGGGAPSFGGCFSDLCYGYNAFWREVLPQLALDADGFEIETMMNVRALHAGFPE